MNKLATFLRDYYLARFLLPVGIMVTVFGIIMIVIMSRTQGYVKTDAVVSKADLYEEEHYVGDRLEEATYDVYVKYTVDGKEYETQLGILPNTKVGEKTKVYYDPKDPSKITQINNMLVPIILIAAGIGAFAGGIVSIIHTNKKRKALKLQEESWENGY